ncbi:hypothetical protein R6Q57_029833 [Mikania cordata]
MDMHVRDIKAKIARGKLPSMEKIQAQRASLNLGLGLGGGARIEIPISGSGIRVGEEVMCGAATKAMFPNMFPINPKEEAVSPPSNPSFDNMPISSVIKINKGPKPTAGTDAAVGSNVEDQEARDQRSQAMVSDKLRMRRRKTMARRKRTTISSDSEPDSEPSEPKGKPEPSEPKSNPKDIHSLMHIHSYIPIVKWSFNAQQKMFTLTKINGGIKVLDIMQLMVIAEPFVFDLEKLPLHNPDNGSYGRISSKWIKARAQKEAKAEELKPKENVEDKPPAEEKKDEEPIPPPPFVLFIDLHCVGCAKKIEKSLLRIPGVVGMDINMEKNQVTIKGVVEPQVVCDKITKKTKRTAKVLSPLPAAEGEPIPQIVTSEVPESVTIELNVNMHCEACALQLKRKILRMKGVRTVETDVSSSKVIVTGSMDGKKLVDYVYRRTKKQATIVPQPEPKPEPVPEPEPAEKPKEEEKQAEEAKPEEQLAKEEKKDGDNAGGDGGGRGKEEEEKKEKGEKMELIDMQRMMYHHQYPPMYVMERIPPPQLFSDENPNACSIS